MDDDVWCERARERCFTLTSEQAFMGVLISILPISGSSTQSEPNNAVIYWLSPLTSIYCVTSIIYSAWDITLLKWLWMQRTCLNNCFSSGIATGGFPRFTAAMWGCHRKTGLKAQLAITASKVSVFAVSAWHSSPVVDDDPSSYPPLISKHIISVTKEHKIVLFRSNITMFCPPWTARSIFERAIVPFTKSSNLQSVCVALRAQNILDRSPKAAPLSFNNKGEDHIALIYCLIKIQPLPSP